MPEPRLLSADAYAGLKSAFRALVSRFGKQEHAASLTRVGQQEISRYGSVRPDDAERYAPIDVIADLEHEVGPVVTEELARLAHCRLVPLPAIARTRNPLGLVTAKAMRETSEVFVRLATFLDDGVLSSAEGQHLDREIDDAIVHLLALKAQVDEEAGKDER